MNNSSFKHHYIPEFYQKGFYGDSGKLYAYTKRYGGIKERTAAQILYSPDLHTVILGKEKTLAIEDFYSKLEGQFTTYRDLLRKNIGNADFTAKLQVDSNFIKIAKIMIATQFWRTPCKRDLAIQYMSRLVDLYDKSSDEVKAIWSYDRKLIKFLSKRASKDEAVKIAQFILLPLISFDISESSENIKLFGTTGEKTFFSSDRPVVYDSLEKLFGFSSFCFPFCKELLLLGTEKNIQRISVDDINKLIAKKAAETVISASKEQLEDFKLTAQKASAMTQ